MARLLSVNVGLPRDVTWQGKTVHTAIWKAPVEGPRIVRRLNIDGDGQGDLAGHGGEHRAVFVYQINSYRYWQNQLGRKDFTYGQFGENFTVEGLSDAEVCIGDSYRIGGASFGFVRVTAGRLRMAQHAQTQSAIRLRGRCATAISIRSVFPESMCPPKLNSVEPPRYGSVCPVVWEGRCREASPYPDLGRDLAVARRPLDGRTPRRPPAICYVRSTSSPAVRCAQRAAVPRRLGERVISDPLLPFSVGPGT